MEHYKNLTVQQLALLAASAMLVGGMLLPRHAILGGCILAVALAFGIGAYGKTRNR